jgi:hypothetical protein
MTDQRLTNQQRYLTGVHLTLKPWFRVRPDWDHDHCAFCWAKFTDLELPNALREGYVTDDDQHWICAQCFEDFHVAFQWRID